MFYLVNSIAPLFQVHACTAMLAMKNHSIVRVTCNTSEAVLTSLTNTIVNRHLLSNLSAINVRMKQIPFTVEYDIKENNKKKPMKHLTPLLTVLCVTRLHSAIVLNYWDQKFNNYS